MIWLFVASVAHAQTPVVEVAVAGAPAAEMVERVDAIERRLAVDVRASVRSAIDVREVLAPSEHTTGLLARVWMDLSSTERAILFVANAGSDRFLVRVIPARDGYGELTQESITTVIESAIDALLAGGEIGVDRGEAVREIETHTGERIVEVEPAIEPEPEPEPEIEPPPEPEAAARPPPRRGLEAIVSGRYRGAVIGDGPALAHGVELGFEVSGFVGPPLDLVVFARVHYAAPHSIGDADRGVELHGGGGRAGLGLGVALGALRVRVGLGAGVDLAAADPRIAADTGLVAADPFLVALPILGAFVELALRPAPSVELLVGGGVDLDLSAHHFDVQSGETRAVVVSPWLVRPHWSVGVGIPLPL